MENRANTTRYNNWEEQSYLESNDYHGMENEICRLKTFSNEEDRALAKKIYSKLQDRIRLLNDGFEKKQLKNLELLIRMKVKSI